MWNFTEIYWLEVLQNWAWKSTVSLRFLFGWHLIFLKIYIAQNWLILQKFRKNQNCRVSKSKIIMWHWFLVLKAIKATNLVENIVYIFRLFLADPTEHHDLAAEYPRTQRVTDLIASLMKRLKELHASMIAPHRRKEVLEGNPNENRGFFGPGWCQSEPQKAEERPDVVLT